MTQMLRDVVQLQGGFKPSVQLPKDFFNERDNRHFVENYIPTQETLNILMRIGDSLQPNSERRAKLFTGTFGTGKSDLMLIIANYVTRSSDDPLLTPFFEKLRNLNTSKAKTIYDARLGKPPFLLVLLQADTAITFSSFVLRGLEETLTKIGEQGLMATTYYRAALDAIADWEQRLPDNIKRLEKVLQEAHNTTLTQLKRRLESPHADLALTTFRAVAREAIGLPFQPTAVIERPDDAFEAAAKQLVDSGKFSGIFVIADEFTHLLKKLAESSTASPDIKAIDNLAESAARSGKNQIHFYTVSLEGFSSAQASTRSSQTALERTGGRFIQGQEELRSQYMEDLISASIAKKVSPERLFAGAPSQQNELLSLAMRLWGDRSSGRHDREWLLETIVQGCFPLHPLVAYCLPLLNRVLAQNERTMFSFLWDEKCGLKAFIGAAALLSAEGWLNLLPLDGLFSYFEINLKERRSDLYLLYQQAKSKLLPEQVNTGLEGRLLQVLVLFDVASGDPNLRSDRDLLRHAVGLAPSRTTEFDAALDQLIHGGIVYPNQAGYYELMKQGQANPQELRHLIERRAQEIVESPIAVLNDHYRPRDEHALGYNKLRGTERKLTAAFVSVSDLANTSILAQELQNVDGLLWYVMTRTEEEQLHARSIAIQLTRQHDQLVIAIPLSPTDLLDRLKRKIAIEHLRNSPDYNGLDYQELLSSKGLVGKDYLSAFEQELQKIGNCTKFEWYYEGKTATVQTPAHLEELATKVMRIVYPFTPAHSTAQHLARSARNASRLREALDEMLQAPFSRSGKKSPVDEILLKGAGELGVISFIRQEGSYNTYAVCAPDQRDQHLQNSRAVWDMLDRSLRNSLTSWSDTVELLKHRPYGLSSPVLQLFFAAFLRTNQDYIEVHTTKNVPNSLIDIDGDKLGKIVESPDDYTILYQPLTDQQTDFLHALERILLPHVEIRSHKREAASLRDQVATLLDRKMKEIPLVSQPLSLNELAEVLPDIPKEILTLCKQLIDISQISDEERRAALLEALPQSLGLLADNADWTSEALERAFSDLESAYKYVLQIPTKLRWSIALQIGSWFELAVPPISEKDVFEAAKKWRAEKVRAVRIGDLVDEPNVSDLLGLLDNYPYSFGQVFLNDLPARWGLHPVGEWLTIRTKAVYLARLEQAKQSVEDKAVVIASTPYGRSNDAGVISQLPTMSAASGENLTLEGTQNIVIPLQKPYQMDELSTPSIRNSASTGASQTNGAVKASQSIMDNQWAARASISTPLHEAPTHEETILTAQQAFATIQSIFETLPSKDQHRLWELLVEEYDPR